MRANLGSTAGYITLLTKNLVGQVGFEPTTLRLKGECSAVELLTQTIEQVILYCEKLHDANWI